MQQLLKAAEKFSKQVQCRQNRSTAPCACSGVMCSLGENMREYKQPFSSKIAAIITVKCSSYKSYSRK